MRAMRVHKHKSARHRFARPRIARCVMAYAWQVGSHYHFLETNPRLLFDRRLAYGRRLNIIAGTAGDPRPMLP